MRQRPRIGALGVGWIGRHRLERVVESGAADVVGLADASPAALDAAAPVAPDARLVSSLEDLLALDLDGLMIATPSAQHAEQCVAALGCGLGVFCQKPLARTAAETRQVVAAARAADRLLAVDLSYRHVTGVAALRDLVRGGALGDVFAADLVFHNAYGPDKAWFYDPVRSGGGCLIDLGIHVLDLALWALDFPAVDAVDRDLRAGGAPLAPGGVEDFVAARLVTDGGASLRLGCSWRLHAGQEAVIEASFYGTRGGASLRNVDGSFYDFVVDHHEGTARRRLAAPPDAWGGRAAVAWARRLARDPSFDPEVERVVDVARALDRVYGRE
ncbi:MAG: Gfo/Idh/MocA family oxidoreductase [Planctomycetes bacterium]|nr:Gfo/Idh/MocA family oxidoreductase [Planctomycetota bacterium]